LLASHPDNRIDDIAFSRAIWPNYSDYSARKVQDRLLGKGFEPLDAKLLEALSKAN